MNHRVGVLAVGVLVGCGEIARLPNDPVEDALANLDGGLTNDAAKDGASGDHDGAATDGAATDASSDSSACVSGTAQATISWRTSTFSATPKTTKIGENASNFALVRAPILNGQFPAGDATLWFNFPSKMHLGAHKCATLETFAPLADSAVVGFSEANTEYIADPNACSVTVLEADDACGHYRFFVRAEYDSVTYGRSKIVASVESYP